MAIDLTPKLALHTARLALRRLTGEGRPSAEEKTSAIETVAAAIALVLNDPGHPFTHRVMNAYLQADPSDIPARLLLFQPDPAWNIDHDQLRPIPILLFTALQSRQGRDSVGRLFDGHLGPTSAIWNDSQLKRALKSADPEQTFWSTDTLLRLDSAIEDLIAITPDVLPPSGADQSHNEEREAPKKPEPIGPVEPSTPSIAPSLTLPDQAPVQAAKDVEASPVPLTVSIPDKPASEEPLPGFDEIIFKDTGVEYGTHPFCKLPPGELDFLRKLAGKCGEPVKYAEFEGLSPAAIEQLKKRVETKLKADDFPFMVPPGRRKSYRLSRRPTQREQTDP